MNKKFAFTLTEVLITLSIVGVISAMTVPTLMNKYQREAQAVQIRKASQEFANAVDMYITSEGKTSLTATGIFAEDEDGNVPGIDSFIESNLRIVKKCDSSNPCFASTFSSNPAIISLIPNIAPTTTATITATAINVLYILHI